MQLSLVSLFLSLFVDAVFKRIDNSEVSEITLPSCQGLSVEV